MKAAYLDSSFAVAMIFGELPHQNLSRKYSELEEVLSCHLLEAEVYSTLAREKVDLNLGTRFLFGISLFQPDDSLAVEYKKILKAGFLRGADLFHLACALHLDPLANELMFFSLNQKQSACAAKLGFRVLP